MAETGKTPPPKDKTTPTVAGKEDSGREAFDTSAKGKVDPSTGEPFAKKNAGLAGVHGADVADDTPRLPAPPPALDLPESGGVPNVDPARIPAEASPGVTPEPAGDRLLAAAQAKAPSLTREFVEAYKLTDADLGAIARGEVPPPPTPGPIHTADLYLTPGGWQQTPPGVPPEDVGKNAIAR